MIEDVLSALQSRRPASNHHALVEARARIRHGSGRQIHVDVVGDEEIEAAVAIVVHKCAAGIPALSVAGDACFLADIGERAVSVVVVEDVLAEVGDEQVVPTVVVVVADAACPGPIRSEPRRLSELHR